jgi:phosphohistidine phosphatase
MSRSLFLFRHAKSDWHSESGRDHERPLAKRGVKAAKAMGRILAASGQVPGLAVTSSALRARTTLELAMKAGGWDCRVTVLDSLYETTHAGALEVIRGLPDGNPEVLLVGHEPTWSDLLAGLLGGGRFRFVTAAMARVDLELPHWSRVAPGTGELAWMMAPRFFTDGRFPGFD